MREIVLENVDRERQIVPITGQNTGISRIVIDFQVISCTLDLVLPFNCITHAHKNIEDSNYDTGIKNTFMSWTR